MITYRIPAIEDSEAIVRFYNIVGGETTYLSFEKDEYPLNINQQEQAIKEMNERDNCMMLLALDNEKIVGIATISSSTKQKSKHAGELGIVVTQDYQGKGIGSQMIQQLIDWAKSNGITTRIKLDTRCDNPGAVELYERFGFQIEGRLINSTLLHGKYYDLYVMGLLLN